MNRKVLIPIASIIVFIGFVLLKLDWDGADRTHELWEALEVTAGGFLTLMIFSFLYKDNAFYKFAEHLYVGISAAYWMCVGFWSNLAQQAIPHLSQSLSEALGQPFLGYIWHYWIPVALGLILLTRLLPESMKIGWISKWTLAFIVASTAGLFITANLQANFIAQIASTMSLPLLPDWTGFGDFLSNFDLSYEGQFVKMFSNWVIIIGVISGLVYFFFSKEHTGWFGRVSRLGIWVLMVTFGAAFGYTVMGRVSLLVGRLTFLFRDWAGVIG